MRYRVHRPHTCAPPLPLPAGRSAGSGLSAAAADCAGHLHAADLIRCAVGRVGCAARAGSVAAVRTKHLAAVQCHTQHSPAKSLFQKGVCGRLGEESLHAAAMFHSCELGCRDSAWQLMWPNPFLDNGSEYPRADLNEEAVMKNSTTGTASRWAEMKEISYCHLSPGLVTDSRVGQGRKSVQEARLEPALEGKRLPRIFSSEHPHLVLDFAPVLGLRLLLGPKTGYVDQ